MAPEIVTLAREAVGPRGLVVDLVELPLVDVRGGFGELGEAAAGPAPDGVPPPVGADAPPAPGEVAHPLGGVASVIAAMHSTASPILVAIEVDCLWTAAAVGTDDPFWCLAPGPPDAGLRAEATPSRRGRATLDVSGLGFPNRR